MKILRLVSENIKRLVAVEIAPDGALVTISGKNGAGKSSVLDSIAYALGGKALIPSEPIRKGQAEAKIEIDLGDLIVIRRFKREKLTDAVVDGETKSVTWGPTVSTLVVKTKDGASYPSPQAILDKFLGELTFDPLAFADDKPANQLETLRKLTNLDTSMLDTQRKTAFDRRAVLKKQVADATVRAKDLPTYDIPETTEISMKEVSDELLRAQELRRTADEGERAVLSMESLLDNQHGKIKNMETVLADLLQRMEKQKELIAAEQVKLTRADEALVEAREAAKAARAAVPDMQAAVERMSEIEQKNVQIRCNATAAKAQAEVTRLKSDVEIEDVKIEDIDAKKEELLSSVVFPVDGLSFGDNGVLFNGLPFEQASTADQIRVSVAMGIALNPTLKVLLVHEGSALDSENLARLAEQAAAADAQVWLERVAESKDGVAILIEDGSVV